MWSSPDYFKKWQHVFSVVLKFNVYRHSNVYTNCGLEGERQMTNCHDISSMERARTAIYGRALEEP